MNDDYIGRKVITPHGIGIISEKEITSDIFNKSIVTGRYGVKVKRPNKLFGFLGFKTTQVLYYFLGELIVLEKRDE